MLGKKYYSMPKLGNPVVARAHHVLSGIVATFLQFVDYRLGKADPAHGAYAWYIFNNNEPGLELASEAAHFEVKRICVAACVSLACCTVALARWSGNYDLRIGGGRYHLPDSSRAYLRYIRFYDYGAWMVEAVCLGSVSVPFDCGR